GSLAGGVKAATAAVTLQPEFPTLGVLHHAARPSFGHAAEGVVGGQQEHGGREAVPLGVGGLPDDRVDGVRRGVVIEFLEFGALGIHRPGSHSGGVGVVLGGREVCGGLAPRDGFVPVCGGLVEVLVQRGGERAAADGAAAVAAAVGADQQDGVGDAAGAR